MTSSSRSGWRPVPGFLIATCSRAMTVPAGRLALATRLRVNSSSGALKKSAGRVRGVMRSNGCKGK